MNTFEDLSFLHLTRLVQDWVADNPTVVRGFVGILPDWIYKKVSDAPEVTVPLASHHSYRYSKPVAADLPARADVTAVFLYPICQIAA